MIITTKNLNKNFLIPVKEPGLIPAIKSLWKPHYENKIAIKDFNLEIEPGEFVGLLGPNGAGKSTLSAVIMGK
ncbi:MAG: ATP-binding cassette domain-containing protein, partial [Candidatus Paceibacterota bacterium]